MCVVCDGFLRFLSALRVRRVSDCSVQTVQCIVGSADWVGLSVGFKHDCVCLKIIMQKVNFKCFNILSVFKLTKIKKLFECFDTLLHWMLKSTVEVCKQSDYLRKDY